MKTHRLFISEKKGQVLLLVLVLFTAAALTIVIGTSSPIVRQLQISRDLQNSNQSYYTAEAGSEDAYYRIKNSLNTSFPEILALGGATTTVTLIPTGMNEDQIRSEGNNNNLIRVVLKEISLTSGFSFKFAVQIGNGGLKMYNNSLVQGNVYSDGPILSQSTGKIYGDAVSAGPNGSITGAYATSSLYAHNLINSNADKNAYYQSIDSYTSSHVSGTKYPNSPDQPPMPMPITDDMIAQWENTAAAGTVISATSSPDKCSNGQFSINNTRSLGNVTINCDLMISGNSVLTLKGNVWVKGNITLQNNSVVKIDNSIGNESIAVIADNPADKINSSQINIVNNTQFYGSYNDQGQVNPDSYIMLISQNNSAESGGNANAINIQNNPVGNFLVYAPHGQITQSNNVALREVTAYRLVLNNNAMVIYQIGLQQPIFMAGPGGKWVIKQWREGI